MKSCPRCGKAYPDTETFCENDGSALAQGGARETTVMAGDEEPAGQPAGVIECPVFGCKAEPGELICNFCGTRLAPETGQASGPSAARSAADSPETFVPAHDRIETRRAAAKTPIRTAESSGGRRLLGVVGYSLAAILALAAGAWLALYLSGAHPRPQVAEVSPAASPAPPSGPSIQLAASIPLQVAGAAASAEERNHPALTKAFEDNKAALFDAYRHALAGGSVAGDGLIVSVHIMPDGSVSGGSVRVSTTPTIRWFSRPTLVTRRVSSRACRASLRASLRASRLSTLTRRLLRHRPLGPRRRRPSQKVRLLHPSPQPPLLRAWPRNRSRSLPRLLLLLLCERGTAGHVAGRKNSPRCRDPSGCPSRRCLIAWPASCTRVASFAAFRHTPAPVRLRYTARSSTITISCWRSAPRAASAA